MSTRLRSAMRMLGRLLIEIVALLFAGLVFGALFVLFTESGAQLALRQLEERTGLIHSTGVMGTLWGPLSVEQLKYEDAYVAVDLQKTTLDWSLLQLLGGRLGISQLHAHAVSVTLKPQPDKPEEPPGPVLTALPVGIDVRELRIGSLDIIGAGKPMHFEQLALDANWLGDVIDVEALKGVTPWVDAIALKGKVQLQPDGVRLDKVGLDGFIAAELDGRYAYHADSDVTLSWSALHWPPAGAGAAIVDSPRGKLHWTGRPEDWRYELASQLLFDGKTYDLTLDGKGSLGGMQAEQASIETGHGRIELQAQLDWQDRFSAKLQARLQGVEPQFWAPQVSGELNGTLDAQLQVNGGKPALQVQLKLDQSTLQGYPATLSADASYDGTQFNFAALDLRTGDTRLQASGKAWPQIALDLNLDSRNLISLQPQLTGNAKARVNLEGRWPQLRARGNLQAGDLQFDKYTAKTVSADFDVATDGESRADVLLGPTYVGQTIESAQLRLRGTTKAHELNASVSTPEGGLALALNGNADVDKQNWTGEVSALRISPRNLPAWTLEEAAALQLSAQKIELAPVCVASDLARFCAGLRPVPGGRRIALRLEQFKLAGLKPWLPAGTALSGQIDGLGYVDLGDYGGLKDLRLDLTTSAIRLSRSGFESFELKPGYAKVEAEGKELRAVASLPFDIDGKTAGGIELDARLGAGSDLMQRSLSGQWRVDMPDISWLELLNHELQKVQGKLVGQLDLGGTLAQPDLNGSVTLSDAGMSLRAPGITIEKVSASLQGRAGAVLTLKSEATSDGGTLHLDGTIDTEGGANAVELNLYGDHFQAIRIPEASVWISPNLQVSFADKALRVGGSLEVPRADLTPKSVNQGVGTSADQIVVRREVEPEEPGPAIYADIRVLLIGDPGMSIDGLGLKSKLGGEIRIIEEPGVVTRARGELQLKDGRYKAYGQDLTITTGRLLFNGGPVSQPAVELRATRQLNEQVTVGVLVRGTLDKPDFSLFSTPAMPQERQLSWLVLGRPLDQTTGSAERGRVADAAVSLGLAGGEWLAQRYGGKIGIDEIGIGAKPGESTDLAQLTIGKYLSPKLFISYGVRLFQPGQSFRMQYDLGGGFKLASEAGVESGGDVLYTIEK